MGALPVREREVLLLFSLEDLSLDACAQIREVPAGTVKSRLNRHPRRDRAGVGGVRHLGGDPPGTAVRPRPGGRRPAPGGGLAAGRAGHHRAPAAGRPARAGRAPGPEGGAHPRDSLR
ncbi:sigma factor-like helix-turn-helix DNA-binding protein [Amycolatopsis pretoriensis]|uniref:RNA polymerase sigma factor n=1 Tax=Amycolatopsis pretoriensis TaxID=218821 RepID=UPI00115FE740